MANKQRQSIMKHLNIIDQNMSQRCKRGSWDYLEVLKISHEITPKMSPEEVAKALGIYELFERWKDENSKNI